MKAVNFYFRRLKGGKICRVYGKTSVCAIVLRAIAHFAGSLLRMGSFTECDRRHKPERDQEQRAVKTQNGMGAVQRAPGYEQQLLDGVQEKNQYQPGRSVDSECQLPAEIGAHEKGQTDFRFLRFDHDGRLSPFWGEWRRRRSLQHGEWIPQNDGAWKQGNGCLQLNPFSYLISRHWPKYQDEFETKIDQTIIGKISVNDFKAYQGQLRNIPEMKKAFQEFTKSEKEFAASKGK
jgi:hypothetical protein